MDFFARNFRYEVRADDSIQAAKGHWECVEDILNAIEWAILHDHDIGRILTERGVRGFLYSGAKSKKEPDVDVIYEVEQFTIIIHDLTFSDAKAHYSGNG